MPQGGDHDNSGIIGLTRKKKLVQGEVGGISEENKTGDQAAERGGDE